MRIPSFIKWNTLKLEFPFGKTILFAILLFPIFLVLLEVAFRIIPLKESVLVPSIDGGIGFPEIDIKFNRLENAYDDQKINCFISGDSTVDFGLNPVFFNKEEILGVNNSVCFNMALEGMMPETTASLINMLNKKYAPSLVIIGINPLDFAEQKYDTKYFEDSAWFAYYNNHPTFEGWLIESSHTYRYWLAFRKYSNLEYRSELLNQLKLIDSLGFQSRELDKELYIVNPVDNFINYKLSPEDINGFMNILSQNNENVKVVVVEMPVHPDYLAYNISGGLESYNNLFLIPIEHLLIEKNIPFYPTQKNVGEIIDQDGWIDNIHLNEKGARQLSVWLADQMVK